MAIGSETQKGEVYKMTLVRVQEQDIEVEIFEDGEELNRVAWELADSSAWDTVSRDVEAVEQVVCGGEI